MGALILLGLLFLACYFLLNYARPRGSAAGRPQEGRLAIFF